VARSPRAGAGRLPIPLSSFVGRLDELARLRVLLEESRLVTLIGFGGIGKSRLALEFARGLEIDARLVDVTWVVDPTMLGAAIVEAVGVPIQTGRAPIDVAAECIAAAPLLLMLDDCESLLEATADAATYLLERCPSVRILATSRAPLGLVGEATWPVPPLSLIADTDAEHPNTPDAVKLFVSRARQVRPEFAPGPHELDTVAQICSELDGIPLAIELAAAWTRVLGLQELRAALADRFGLLDSSRRATPKRSQTLLASLDWSHDLLTEPAKRVFRRLASFSEGCTLEAATAVAGEGSEVGAVLAAITGLVESGLLSMREEGGAARYEMLDTIRQYSLERLEESHEASEVRARHVAYFLTFAEQSSAESLRGDRDGRLRLDLELPNLRAAVMYAIESHPEAGQRICSALVWHWRERGHYREGVELLERSLAAAPEQATTARARALGALAMLVGYAGDQLRSVKLNDEVIELAEQADDSFALAFGLIGQAIAIATFDPAEGWKALERAEAVARDSRHPILLGDAHMWMVFAAALAGDETRLEPQIEETLAIAEPLQHRQAIAWCWWARGIQAHARAQPSIMRECAERVLSGAMLVVEPVIHAYALHQLVIAATMTGEAEQLREQVIAERERSKIAGTVAPLPELDLALAEIDLASSRVAAARTTASSISTGPMPLTGQQRWQSQHALARAALCSADWAAAGEHATLLGDYALGDPRPVALARVVQA
jgi:predicted ATPase